MSGEPKRNPVQIVLNASHFVTAQENPPGGSNKDFFGDKDAEFAKHKAQILSQVKSIRESFVTSGSIGQTAYVKVTMREDAWAKSHRPSRKLFDPARFVPAGADGIGELFYEVTASSIPMLEQAIEGAELVTRTKLNKKTNKSVFNPSRQRSEVGAIQGIRLPEEADRRSFSTEEALRWLADERSGNLYLVDVFNLARSKGHLLQMPLFRQKLYENFVAGLNALPCGFLLFRSSLLQDGGHDYLFLRPTLSKRTLTPADLFNLERDGGDEGELDKSSSHHEALLAYLSSHPLVREVLLPPIVEKASSATADTLAMDKPSRVPITKSTDVKYPRIGIIDSGVSKHFASWTLARAGVLTEAHRNEVHGSIIAGLLVAARDAGNPENVALEADGCEIYDLDIFPDQAVPLAFKSYYPKGFIDFIHQLDLAVAEAKLLQGVRIFNLSLNVTAPVSRSSYGPYARLLDAVADKHDVIIVVSAGNLDPADYRNPWPELPADVAGHLLPHAGLDGIFMPAECVSAISVGALNPPGNHGQLEGAPARYTRRGPGMAVGIKPDFAHFGGAASNLGTGLLSFDADGKTVAIMGTSFAAPLVAKTLGVVESRIQGHITRQTLFALLVHKALVPQVLAHPELQTIGRNFVGFGMPASAETILLTESNAITMVFDSVITPGRELKFDFTWPKRLTSAEGSCRGKASLTLVYRPPLDASFGAEFVRLNLDAHLRQHIGDGHYRSKTTQAFMKKAKNDAHFEAALIEGGLKWWPMKHYTFNSPEGIGDSSDWRLVVEPLLRDSAVFPSEGVPFSAILTITDPDIDSPIFDEMRLWLNSANVQCEDIRTAIRIRPNVGGTGA